jgi:hypothetical protein
MAPDIVLFGVLFTAARHLAPRVILRVDPSPSSGALRQSLTALGYIEAEGGALVSLPAVPG